MSFENTMYLLLGGVASAAIQVAVMLALLACDRLRREGH